MSIEAVISALDSFVPSDSDSKTAYDLYQIFDGFRALSNRERAIPAMFSLFERHLEAEFGTRGPLVHELEDIPGYQPFLIASLARQPSGPAIHMVNRILNSPLSSAERESWLGILSSAAAHPLAPEFVRDEARYFIRYQAARRDAQQ